MTLSASYSRPRPKRGFEAWSWIFMRVSGLLLLFLALGHMVLMHLIHNVDEINYAFVANRYAGWLWRGYDLLMLVLAMIHGTNGTRILIDDYVHPQTARWLSLGLLYVVCGSLLSLGVYVALWFRPISS